MRLKTLIIDDEQFALDKLQNYIDTVPEFDLVAACADTATALSVMNNNKIDVIYTDIDMPDVNGYKFVDNLLRGPIIVFVTGYRDYPTDTFRVSAVDQLVKPYDTNDFQRTVDKVFDAYRKKYLLNPAKGGGGGGDVLSVKVENRVENIPMRNIRCIKGYGAYLQIFVSDRKNAVTTITPFDEIMKQLSSNFIQVHKLYAVNMDKVQRVEKKRVIMDDYTIVAISVSYRDGFLSYLHDHAIGKVFN